MASNSTLNKPLHTQRLEHALNLNPFMKQAEEILNQAIDSDDDEPNSEGFERYLTYEQKSLMYNSESVGERKWLYNMLLSDTESESEISDEDAYVSELLKNYVQEKKYRADYYENPEVSRTII